MLYTVFFSINKKMFALQLKNLKKTYDNGFEAIKGIDLNVCQGDFFALLGANGAGKSTTIGLICDLIKKTSGEIIINGHHLDKDKKAAKMSLGIVPQEFNLPVFETCEEVLLNTAGFYGIPRHKAICRAHWLLAQLGLEDKKDSIVYQLSGGMKRRLMIARSLIHKPKLLILDEPSAGVDIEIRRSIWTFLKDINAHGTTIILTTHYLEEAEQLCNQLAIIHHGLIVEQCSVQELLASQKYQTYVFTTLHPIQNTPQLMEWQTKFINDFTFEVTMPKGDSLNKVFLKLVEQNIHIQSVSHKTNRLEALFLELIKDES
jgi:ABC-2 type transport system ATP-binding protein